MSNQKSPPLRRTRWQPGIAFSCALAATLLAGPVEAVTIPNLPLQSGAAYPPPNLLFILDDSGSMDDHTMDPPEGVPGVTNNDLDESKSYLHNTIYYDPEVDYEPWMGHDGNRLTGGTNHEHVYADLNNVGGSTIDLTDSGSCQYVSFNSAYNNTWICGGDQTWYVPKSADSDLSKIEDYWRYQIRHVNNDGTSEPRVVRSEYLPGGTFVTPSGFPKTGLTERSSDDMKHVHSFTVPAGVVRLVVELSGGTHGNNNNNNNNQGDGANLYVRRGGEPTSSNYDCRSRDGGNEETCTINHPDSGTWYAGIARDPDYGNNDGYRNVRMSVTWLVSENVEGVSGAGCESGSSGTGWRNCTFATPDIPGTDRSEAQEITNFATWFSYFRTRMKTAKAGASEAFGQLGASVRVGYDSIWNRNKTNDNDYKSLGPSFPVPVNNDDGLFRGENRKAWFGRLHGADGRDGTPLHDALFRAGEYFSKDSSNGPWGPASGADQISCRQNFAILTTDGYWNSRSKGSKAGDYVGNSDNVNGLEISSPTGATYQYKAGNPYDDNYSDTLADIAMAYWKKDLRDALDNNVPNSAADPAFWQHMVTFGVAIGLSGELDPAVDLPALVNGSKNWPNPDLGNTSGSAEIAARIDDLWHASVNGRGSFVSARNPTEFVDGLSDALATVAQRLSSASNVTANSTSFRADTRVYQASYVSGSWIGELAAYDATSAGVADTPTWLASQHIPAHADRDIFTWNGTAGATFPTNGQQSALDQSGRSMAPVDGATNANYIRGDQTEEERHGGELRDRATVLGDIVNSSPTYVRDSETIFVGANDGMLHAINALTGAERFAYVPSGINFGDLASLSDPEYSPNHRYFVDGPVVVSTTAQTPGKNYLVGALGRGGKGVFALDVTDPANFDVDDVMWELNSDVDMGHVLGAPLVVKLNNGSAGLLVSNGINSSSGKAALFVVNVATGVVLQKIDTKVGGDNGLSEPRGWDNDGDGTVDVVYAGDLKGNLWKFDLSSEDPTKWASALGTAAAPEPLFVARDSSGNAQPITAGIALGAEPVSGAQAMRMWVFVGTGSFMTTADVDSKDVQSLYGLIDDGTAITKRSDLEERDILVSTTSSGTAVRAFESHDSNPLKTRGWFIDLDDPSAGERVVSRPQIRGSVLLVPSLIPPKDNTCDAGGSGFITAIDAFSGTSLAAPYFDLNKDGDFSNDTLAYGDTKVPIGSVDLGVGMPTLPTVIDRLLVVGGSRANMASILVNPQGGEPRRTSWREIRRN